MATSDNMHLFQQLLLDLARQYIGANAAPHTREEWIQLCDALNEWTLNKAGATPTLEQLAIGFAFDFVFEQTGLGQEAAPHD